MTHLEILGTGTRSYVFVHGSPSDRRVWDDVVALAPSDVALVRLDLPDHGEASDEPTASLRPLEEAVLDAVEAAPGEVTVVGHSMGAWLVAATSARMPERVRRFVSVCGMAEYAEEGLAMRRNLLEQIESGEMELGVLRETLSQLFFGQERSAELDARVGAMLDLSRAHWARLCRRSLEIGDRAPAYFTRAATVVHATGDAGIPVAQGRALAQGSGAELVEIETTSHMLPMTHASQLAKIIFQE